MLIPWRLLALTLVAAAGLILYWPSLHHPIFFDDIGLFNRNGLNKIFIDGSPFDIRWLPYFLTAWVDLIFDDKVFAQRLINVGLHLSTAYVLYTLIERVAQHAAPHRNNQRAALAAALLFLLHPLSVYAVGYLAQRTIMMATLFGLLSLKTYFDGLISGQKSIFLISGLFFLLAVFSKEHTVLMPLAAAALTPLATTINRQTWRALVVPMSLYLLVIAIAVLQRQHILGHAYEPFVEHFVSVSPELKGHGALWLLSIQMQATLFFKYLLLAVLPYPGWMSIDMRVALPQHLWHPKYLLGVLALAAYGVMALLCLFKRGKRGLVGYALLAPLLLFAVEFSTVRFQEPFVLYRSYLWIPLLLLLIPAMTNAVPDRVFWAVLLTLAGIFAVASNDRLNSFSSEYALWDDAVKKLPNLLAPGSARAFNNRGRQNLQKGNYSAAIADCTRAIQANPKYQTAYQVRAFAYLKRGNFQAAIQDANTVARLFPEDPNVYTLLGAVYRGAGQIDEAIVNFELACKRDLFTACYELEAMKAPTRAGANLPK